MGADILKFLRLVQSFLTSKQAVQTTMLSSLDFDQTDKDGGYIDMKQFLELAEKTLDRHECSNLMIQSFRLCMRVPAYWDSGRATKLVQRALKLGPTHLTFDFNVTGFVIPGEVFTSENIVSLSFKWCKINANREVIGCSRLQSLSLEYVQMKSRDMLFHVLSSCPLIEKLSLRCVNVVGGSVDVGDDGLQTINLHRLRSLVVDSLGFDTTLFLGDLSSKFPSLKDLTLRVLVRKDREEIMISSPSLECLDFKIHRYTSRIANTAPRVDFDVPRIRKLTFEASTIPKLSIKSSSRGWESHLILRRGKCLSPSWFRKLSKFLNKFRRSTLKSLSLHPSPKTSFEYEPGDNIIQGFPKPEIQNLNIYLDYLPSLSCYALFDGLFRMCRPKVITQYISSDYSCSYNLLGKTSNIHFLGKRLLDARDAKVLLTPNNFMYGLNDLKEAKPQVFDEAVSAWRDVRLESLLDDLTTAEGGDRSGDKDHSLSDDDDDEDHTQSDGEKYDASTTKGNPIIRFQLNWQTLAA